MKIDDFKNPGVIHRPAPFWSWNDKLEKEELARQIKEMHKKNWGGFFMHSRVGLITEYLSDEWFDLINSCVKEAKKENMIAWIYDEDKWPSGYGGGAIAKKNTDFIQKILILRKKSQITENDTILKKVVYNNEQFYISKYTMPLNIPWFNNSAYVDLMNKKVMDEFIKEVLEKYKEKSSSEFGKTIAGIFTDEPQYIYTMSELFGNSPYLPWSDELPEFFFKRKKYNILKHLEKLFFKIDNYKKVRYDFFDSATRLFINNFTKRYYEWCDKNNLKLTGHMMREDSLLEQVLGSGATMPHYEFFHWPGIDKLRDNIVDTITVKQLSSVAEQLGKEKAISESFGASGQYFAFKEQRFIGDWLSVLGVTFINQHLSLYTMKGERKRDFPPNIFYQQPWWDFEDKMALYQARVSYAVSNGKRNIDFLIFHPVHSVWCEFEPSFSIDEDYGEIFEKYNTPFKNLTDKLLYSQYDFHYFDEIIGEKYASVKKGKLVVGNYSYDKLIIPPAITLSKNTVELLEEFINSDGKIFGFGLKPYLANGEQSQRVKSLAKKVKYFETLDELINFIKVNYPSRLQVKDYITNESVQYILFQERILTKQRVYFIHNTSKIGSSKVVISLKNTGDWFEWNLLDGTKKRIYPFEVRKGYSSFLFDMNAGDSILLSCEKSNNIKVRNVSVKEKRIITIVEPEKYSIKNLDMNALLIDKATLKIDNKIVIKNSPVFMGWDEYFYKAKDNTPFEASYNFYVDEIPDSKIYAMIESASNLNLIKINNNTVSPIDKIYLNDPSFELVDISDFVKTGENKLVIKGKKINNIVGPNTHIPVNNWKDYKTTEFEHIFILGNFKVRNIDNKIFKIVKNNNIKTNGFNITKSGYPFYAGKFSVKVNIDIPADKVSGDIFMELQDVKTAGMMIKVNDNIVDKLLWEPYRVNIGKYIKPGKNKVEIILATTLFNLISPNKRKNPYSIWVGPDEFRNWNDYTEQYTFEEYRIGNIIIYK